MVENSPHFGGIKCLNGGKLYHMLAPHKKRELRAGSSDNGTVLSPYKVLLLLYYAIEKFNYGIERLRAFVAA